jgi:hypothetical protein
MGRDAEGLESSNDEQVQWSRAGHGTPSVQGVASATIESRPCLYLAARKSAHS